jgi:hypothetical protein
MRNSLTVLLALAIILGAGVAQGVWSNRWGSPFDYERITATLQGVPKELGDWDAVDQPLDEVSMRVGRIDAYLSRLYTNRNTQDQVAIMLVCGQPGPISLHPPTICFASAGNEQTTPVTTNRYVYSPSGADLSYLTTDFSRTSGGMTSETRVLWSWKGSGPWLAPTVPRWSFGSEAILGKLYVVRVATELEPLRDGQAVDASMADLLDRLVPELDRVMKALPACRVPAT